LLRSSGIDELLILILLFIGRSGWFRRSLKVIGSTPGGAYTDILRFTMEIFVYRWLVLFSDSENLRNQAAIT
jgi:hypothetical protein